MIMNPSKYPARTKAHLGSESGPNLFSRAKKPRLVGPTFQWVWVFFMVFSQPKGFSDTTSCFQWCGLVWSQVLEKVAALIRLGS